MMLDEMDRLAAEKIMEWRYNPDIEAWIVNEENKSASYYVKRGCYTPTRTIFEAWKLWEKLADSGKFCCMDIRKPIHEGWEVAISRVGHDEDHPQQGKPFVLIGGGTSQDSAPLTITKACLMAYDIHV